MSRFRIHQTWLAATTLTLQLGVMVAAATVMCCGASSTAATSKSACCEDSGSAHICPLKTKQNREPGTPMLENCCDIDQQVLAALLGFAGIPEPRSADQPIQETSRLTPQAVEQLVSLVTPPQSPPPRS